MGEFTHGMTGYNYYKCRCDVCKAAKSEWARKKRSENKTLDRPFEHGQGGYSNHFCRCDVCVRANSEYQLGYRSERREHLAQQSLQYYYENRDQLRAKSREYYEAHREERREASKKWNRETGYSKAYYRENRDRILEYSRLRRSENPEYHRSQTKKNRELNPGRHSLYEAKRRALKRSVGVLVVTYEQLSLKWSYYGNLCWMCGEAATVTDHVKPLSKGGSHLLANLRPACAPCNSRKHNKWEGPRRLGMFQTCLPGSTE